MKNLVLLLGLIMVCLCHEGHDHLHIDTIFKPEKCELRSKNGDKLSMHYDGFLINGNKFDSSRDRKQPFDFIIGRGQVIKGWEEGLLNMCPGEKRKLTIPASKGYGDRAMGKIPAKSTLIFETELLSINGKTE